VPQLQRAGSPGHDHPAVARTRGDVPSTVVNSICRSSQWSRTSRVISATSRPWLADGVMQYSTRWRERAADTIPTGCLPVPTRSRCCARAWLEKLVISATSLEISSLSVLILPNNNLSLCAGGTGVPRYPLMHSPRFALPRHPRGLYKSKVRGHHDVLRSKFSPKFEQRGVDGYPTVWDIKKPDRVEELEVLSNETVRFRRGGSGGFREGIFNLNSASAP